MVTAAARQACPQSQRVPGLSKNKSWLSAWAGHSEDSPHALRCTCIATLTSPPRTPLPCCQCGCWCSVAPSAHATRAGASREADVVLMVPTLPAALQPLIGLQPLLVVVMSLQVVQVPVLVLLMMAFTPALKVATLALSNDSARMR